MLLDFGFLTEESNFFDSISQAVYESSGFEKLKIGHRKNTHTHAYTHTSQRKILDYSKYSDTNISFFFARKMFHK